MKNKIKSNIGKLFVAVVSSIIATGAVFAQKPDRLQTFENSQESIEKIRKQLEQVSADGQLKINGTNIPKSAYVSAVNQSNFNLGTNFIIALNEAECIDSDRNAKESAIVRVVYMIDAMEGRSEAAALRRTLQSLVRGTTNAVKVSQEISDAMKSYTTSLSVEQKWFYDSGKTVTTLIFNTYRGNEPAMKKNLSEIQNLVKTAPNAVSEKIIAPMQALAAYASNTNFAENDRTAVVQGAVGVFDSINV